MFIQLCMFYRNNIWSIYLNTQLTKPRCHNLIFKMTFICISIWIIDDRAGALMLIYIKKSNLDKIIYKLSKISHVKQYIIKAFRNKIR